MKPFTDAYVHPLNLMEIYTCSLGWLNRVCSLNHGTYMTMKKYTMDSNQNYNETNKSKFYCKIYYWVEFIQEVILLFKKWITFT